MAKKKYYVRPDGLHESIRTINGKRVAFRGKSDREVDKKIAAYTQKAEAGRTYGELADQWERERFPELKAGTVTCYKPALRRTVELFGHRPAKSLQPLEIDRYIKGFARRGYAGRTTKVELLVISLICEFGIVQGDLELNPCAAIKVPRNLPKETREAITPAQEAAVSLSDNEPFFLFAWLCLFAGLRRGEVLGLRYEDIDHENRSISVRQKLSWPSNQPCIDSFLKSAAGRRDVIMLDKLANVIPRTGTGLIFPGGGGNGMTESEYRKTWLTYCQAIGCASANKTDFTPHQLRHSFATMCFDAGVDSKTASKILGHSKEEITRDIYTHISESREKITADKLNVFVNQKIV